MRVGSNPQKSTVNRLSHKEHRIIIPIHIPNLEDKYYQGSFTSLSLCLESLIDSVDRNLTNITLVSNDSCDEVNALLRSYFNNGHIDKLVVRNENRGKLEVVLAEARASYERFITLSDCDVFFVKGWEEGTFDIFAEFRQAGAVSMSPAPHLAMYCNESLFVDNLFSNRLYRDCVIPKMDLEMFENSINNREIFLGGSLGRNVKDSHYVIKGNKIVACVGCGHFATTYRRELFFVEHMRRVPYVFRNGYEYDFIDSICRVLGFWRLSSIKAMVFHLGNHVTASELEFYKSCSCERRIENAVVYDFQMMGYTGEWWRVLVNRMKVIVFRLLVKLGIRRW